MRPDLQEGIYFRKKPPVGNSFCVISFRLKHDGQTAEAGNIILEIWNRLRKLKQGFLVDLPIDAKHRIAGNMTTLIGYSSKIFEIPGAKKKKPESFSEKWNFNPPNPNGGGPVIKDSGLSYMSAAVDNHLLSDEFVIQIIADSEFFTSRAVVEVWKQGNKINKQYSKSAGNELITITGVYGGFRRPDGRNWLGFHDGVSNLTSSERSYVIPISSHHLKIQDEWTINGTYLAFMRIKVDLEKWVDIQVDEQEKIIGRDKLTGCPLIRIGSEGKPFKDPNCPVLGTSEVIDRGNERFRDHPNYEKYKDKILLQSHIASTRPIETIPIWDRKSLRIYRQGFEYILPSNHGIGFNAGLNFVSFQNSPERLHRSLSYQSGLNKLLGVMKPNKNLNDFMVVSSAGIFFVPPVVQFEPFPGASIFFSSNEMNKINIQNRTSSKNK